MLFTDQVGSTELRSRLGEDQAEELRRTHDRVIAEATKANQGRLVKHLGDGVMATFTGASSALGAAVAIQQGLDRHNRSNSRDRALEVRIGISAGDVVFEGDDCFGSPVIEAARLCAVAGSGQILVTDVVRALAGTGAGHRFEPVGALELKGLPAPVPASEVAWEPRSERAFPMPALLTRAGRIFVGRDEELHRLLRLWEEAMAGERRVAVLAGEPGIGKTRLAVELAGAAGETGGLVLAGRCDEDLGVPYQPFVEALRHYVSHAETRRLGRYAGELTRLVPEIAQLVASLPEPLSSDPETERYRLFDALAAWLADLSADTPILLLLDDLHWAAKPTLLLLRHVLRSPESLRLLVVVTYRDSEIGRGHPMSEFLAELRRDEGVERLTLSGLDSLGVTAFIEAAAGRLLDDEVAHKLPGVVWRETEGNPFFVEEVLRHLTESRVIEQRDGRWVLNADVGRLGIPEGVRDVVGQRLSRFAESTNRVLATAAVVGLEFEPAIVAQAGGIGEDELLTALEEATRARLLLEVPGARYRFAHALVRATLYDELTGARRVALHRRAAEAIESLHTRALDDHLPALAHHWARASASGADTARAVDYATRAGDRALAQFANDEAVVYYRQALELLVGAEGPSDDGQRLKVLLSLGEAQGRAGDPSHRETLLEAGALARELGDTSALTRAALGNTRGFLPKVVGRVDTDLVGMLEAALDAVADREPRARARLLANLGVELVFAGDWRRCLALSDEALALARSLGEPETLARVLLARNFPSCIPDLLEERLANTAELLMAVEGVPDPALRAESHLLHGRAALEAGDVAEADRCFETADRLSGGLGQPALRWRVTYIRACRAIVAGRFGEAERLLFESRELGRLAGQADAEWVFAQELWGLRLEQGLLDDEIMASLDPGQRLLDIPWVDAVRALGAAELGHDEDAREALARFSQTTVPFDIYWLVAMANWATVAAHLGDTEQAERLVAALLPYSRQAVPLVALPTPSVAHHLGLLTATLGRYDEADGHFRDAVAIHERLGAAHWVARTRLEWARMLLARAQPGDAGRAQDLLRRALGTAQELGLASVERRAAPLLT